MRPSLSERAAHGRGRGFILCAEYPDHCQGLACTEFQRFYSGHQASKEITQTLDFAGHVDEETYLQDSDGDLA